MESAAGKGGKDDSKQSDGDPDPNDIGRDAGSMDRLRDAHVRHASRMQQLVAATRYMLRQVPLVRPYHILGLWTSILVSLLIASTIRHKFLQEDVPPLMQGRTTISSKGILARTSTPEVFPEGVSTGARTQVGHNLSTS